MNILTEINIELYVSLQVINFSSTTIAVFIGVVGILSIVAQVPTRSHTLQILKLEPEPEPLCVSPQTLFLTLLMRYLGNKNTVLLGLGFQILQLAWYGFGSEPW